MGKPYEGKFFRILKKGMVKDAYGRGVDINDDFLKQIEINFEKNKNLKAVPVKISHDKNGEMVGKIGKLKRIGDELHLSFSTLTDKAVSFVRDRLLHSMSGEIEKTKNGYELTRVALLSDTEPAIAGATLNFQKNDDTEKDELVSVYTNTELKTIDFEDGNTEKEVEIILSKNDTKEKEHGLSYKFEEHDNKTKEEKLILTLQKQIDELKNDKEEKEKSLTKFECEKNVNELVGRGKIREGQKREILQFMSELDKQKQEAFLSIMLEMPDNDYLISKRNIHTSNSNGSTTMLFDNGSRSSNAIKHKLKKVMEEKNLNGFDAYNLLRNEL